MRLRLTDRYELRTSDALNMQLWERREVRASHTTDRAGEVDWMPTGSYFQDVPSAVRFVFAKLQRDDPYRGDLKGALQKLEWIADNLAVSVREGGAA